MKSKLLEFSEEMDKVHKNVRTQALFEEDYLSSDTSVSKIMAWMFRGHTGGRVHKCLLKLPDTPGGRAR